MNYKKRITEILNQWKADNNFTGDYIVHHRDDTEECREYNKAHYKRWGFSEDDTFEYGKYVIFMTRSDHMRHHRTGAHLTEEQKRHLSEINTGERHPRYGKEISESERVKLSKSKLGDKNPMKNEAHRLKMGETRRKRQRGISILYKVYKANNGTADFNQFRRMASHGEITFEMRPVSVFINGGQK